MPQRRLAELRRDLQRTMTRIQADLENLRHIEEEIDALERELEPPRRFRVIQGGATAVAAGAASTFAWIRDNPRATAIIAFAMVSALLGISSSRWYPPARLPVIAAPPPPGPDRPAPERPPVAPEPPTAPGPTDLPPITVDSAPVIHVDAPDTRRRRELPASPPPRDTHDTSRPEPPRDEVPEEREEPPPPHIPAPRDPCLLEASVDRLVDVCVDLDLHADEVHRGRVEPRATPRRGQHDHPEQRLDYLGAQI